MNALETALWWARSRALGPARHESGTPAPDGFLRLLEPDWSDHPGEVWLLPAHPGTAGPWVLDEMGLSGPSVEQPNDTARMLAAVVRCCWVDVDLPIWPGQDADWSAVMSVYRTFGDREESVVHRAATGAIRRLHGGGWVLWDESRKVVRLGPRCGTWVGPDLTVLRELWRSVQAPDDPENDDLEDVREDEALESGAAVAGSVSAGPDAAGARDAAPVSEPGNDDAEGES